MSSPEIRIGLIGPGGMGTVHLRNYEHIEGARVVAVCAHSPASAERAGAEGVDVYTDADAMLSRGDIDLVDICTPTYTHPEHVKNALLHNKHVICEKPLALHAADARELFAMARERGKRLFVAQVLRYSTPAAVLRELVQSGEYGRMLDAQFLRLSACPRWSKSGWLFRREQSGHIPFDLHIHDLDLILSLWGEPESVSCTSTGREGLDYREHYRFSYVFPGGATVSAEAAWYNADIPFTATWRVYFESAVAVFDGEKVTVYAFDREPRVISTEEKLKIPTGINVPPTGMFHAELSDFLRELRGGEHGLSPTEAEIVRACGILEGALGGN